VQISTCHYEARECRGNLGGAVAKVFGDRFVSPHLPTEIASSLALLAKTVVVMPRLLRGVYPEPDSSLPLRCTPSE